MRTAARSAGYGALLVAAFAAAWTAGLHRAGRLRGPSHPAPRHPRLSRRPPPTRDVAGPPTSRPRRSRRSAPSRVAEVDGYQVRLDGDLAVGTPAQVFVTVSRDGAGGHRPGTPRRRLRPARRAACRRPRAGARSPGRDPAGTHRPGRPRHSVHRRGAGGRDLPADPRLPARRCGAHGRVHAARRLTDDARKAGDDQHAHTGPRRRRRSRRRAGRRPRAAERPDGRVRGPHAGRPHRRRRRTRTTRCGPRRRSPWPP